MEGVQRGDDDAWRIVVPVRVIRETQELPVAVRREARDIISALADDPTPPDLIELRNNSNMRRIAFYYGQRSERRNHVALYIIYQIFEASRTVRILRDGLTYRGFDRR